jgi:NitT/TauT family transport system substrate-binding protein
LLGKARNRPAANGRKSPKKPLSCRWWSTEVRGARMRNRSHCGRRGIRLCVVWALTVVCLFSGALRAQTTIRVGAFPNITHAQPMIGKAYGWFEKTMGSNVKIQWTSFNAGPSAIEALFAGAIDMTYVGPNPAITGYVRSQGEALRVVAGAASGGASLIVRSDSGIQKPEDLHGKKIASPQLGNTQDVALRAWLKAHGMKSQDKGGDVQVVPLVNPDQLTLFLKKELDAAWAPEPWATRLIREGNGRLFLDEREMWPHGQFVTTDLIVSTKFLREHVDLVKNWIRAHVELTDWINAHQPEAKKLLNQQIQKETSKALAAAILDEAFARLQITYDPVRSSLLTSAPWAFDAGFPGRQMPDLTNMYDLSMLNEVLAEKGRKAIQ